MIKPLSEGQNFRLLQDHPWSSWTSALVFSLILNIVLFGSMTGLIDSRPRRPEYLRHLERVNFIRIKRPESPVKKRERHPRIRSLSPKRDLVMKNLALKNPMKRTLDLPFEINPKLPAVSGTLPCLPIEKVAIGPSGLRHVYGMGEIDRPLIPYVQTPPIYPMEARRRGIEGWVKVRFVVMENGKVGDIEILDHHPGGIFDRAVVRCISAWRFSPGTVEGIPVKTQVETTVRFELQK
jgi:protein TonB